VKCLNAGVAWDLYKWGDLHIKVFGYVGCQIGSRHMDRDPGGRVDVALVRNKAGF